MRADARVEPHLPLGRRESFLEEAIIKIFIINNKKIWGEMFGAGGKKKEDNGVKKG